MSSGPTATTAASSKTGGTGPRANGSSLEVDFILRRGNDLVALEVRSGRKVFDADLRGLRAGADLPHVVRRIVVCRGDRRQKTADGIDILPVAAFLAQLERQSLFP